MIKSLFLLSLSFCITSSLSAQTIQKKPADDAYYAEAAGNINPGGRDTGDAVVSETGVFTRISKHQDYGLTVTRLVVDLGEGSAVTIKDLPEGAFEVSGSSQSDKVTRNITSLSVTDSKGDRVESGRYVTIDLDVGFDSDADSAYVYTVTANLNLGKYTKGATFVQNGRTVRK